MRFEPAQLDLFVADALDVRAKHVLDLMSRNLFALSKKPRHDPILHSNEDSFIRVTASPEHGMATVYDQDILIFMVSQLVHAKNMGQKISRRIQFSGYEYWRFTGKQKASGSGYEELYNALERLHHTHIETDIRLGKKRRNHQFTWLSEVEQRWDGNKHVGYQAVMPEWLYDAVNQDRPWVLTLDRRYFSLSSPIERWLYLFARKAAGTQKNGWYESIESLHAKSASTNSRSQFAKAVRRVLERTDNSLFEYKVSSALLGQRPGLHFERNNLIPEKQYQPLLIME